MTSSLLLSLAIVVGAPAKKDAPKEPPNLEGDWLVETMDAPLALPGPVTWRFSKDKVMVTAAKPVKSEEASIVVDFAKKPATIDIAMGEGAKSKTLLGIIVIDGDNMRLCWALEGDKRPTEFKAVAEKKIVLATLRRIKPEK